MQKSINLRCFNSDEYSSIISIITNKRKPQARMRERVIVVVLSVCLSVCNALILENTDNGMSLLRTNFYCATFFNSGLIIEKTRSFQLRGRYHQLSWATPPSVTS